MGVPYHFTKTSCHIDHYALKDDQVAAERDRYYRALQQCKMRLIHLKNHLNEEGADKASSVITSHALLTDDILFQETAEEQIGQERCNVESILTRKRGISRSRRCIRYRSCLQKSRKAEKSH